MTSNQSIPIDRIEVSDRQRAYREDEIANLAGSIREVGLLNPITVVRINDGYRLVTGRHRLEAFRVLGRAEIPAFVHELDGLDAELAEIDENLARTELTVLERGEHLLRRSEILKAKGTRARAGRPR